MIQTKTSAFLFNCYIKFTYKDSRYKLVDCLRKELCNAIRQEASV